MGDISRWTVFQACSAAVYKAFAGRRQDCIDGNGHGETGRRLEEGHARSDLDGLLSLFRAYGED